MFPMAENADLDKNEKKNVFVCNKCGFSVPYDYFGRKPPFSKAFV